MMPTVFTKDFRYSFSPFYVLNANEITLFNQPTNNTSSPFAEDGVIKALKRQSLYGKQDNIQRT